MAINAAIVFEVRSGGSDNNGGGFKTGASGTDRTLQTNAQANITTLSVVNATTTKITVSLTDYTVSTTDVGNCYNNTGGTSTAGLYEITAVDTVLNIWTLDRSIGTAGQTCTGAMGGCFATPGKACAVATVDGHRIWVDDATYTMTTATVGSAGPCKFPTTSTNIKLEGYQTTRGDRTGTMPILNWGAVASPGSTTYMFTGTGTLSQSWHNITADGNSVANVSGWNLAQAAYFCENCIAQNMTGASQFGFEMATNTVGPISCKASNCTTGFDGGMSVIKCRATACGTGFIGCTSYIACVADACTTYNFRISAGAIYSNCVAYGNTGGPGWSVSGTTRGVLSACVAISNSTYGFDVLTTSFLMSCASYNNTTARLNGSNIFIDQNPITCTGDPFTSSTDFRPDNTASEGALLRSVGLGVQGQTDNRDVGAMQHADPAATGGMLVHPGMAGGARG